MVAIAWTVAALVVLGAGVAPSAGSGEEAPLRYSLSAAQRVVQGQPVEVRFTLFNAAREPLYVLTWYTPLEGLLGDILRVTRDGTPLGYQGPLVKRGDPEREDYVRIGPGESVSAVIDVSRGYPVEQPGDYTVDFSGRLFDVAAERGEIPRSRNDQRPMEIPGSGCSFRVVTR
jgi:peptidyl-Lys metalloendopeptidase